MPLEINLQCVGLSRGIPSTDRKSFGHFPDGCFGQCQVTFDALQASGQVQLWLVRFTSHTQATSCLSGVISRGPMLVFLW